ncbi:Tim10/DDP family zinc finger-domain-containing protein [Phascolomyces articulosus]|uniref:Mitochondrial import inner membrane translocase subunit n=1 Tax=Phascolomyces articulosus TaxID=60185 RepID=A0AAD5KX17_9FUNG|nr:Tim10/DDP family zinc finger-domain-containing protein [Phascolomyces articulosus]
MSWSGSFSQNFVNPDNLVQAEQEFDAFMDLYQRIMTTCRNKCIPPHYHEPDLNKGESVCIDRCVFKYGAVQKLLGKKMDEQAANNMGNIGSSGGGIPSTL